MRSILADKTAKTSKRKRKIVTTAPKNADLDPDYLVAYSQKDAVWDVHKSHTDLLSAMYQRSKLTNYANRTAECSGFLTFTRAVNRETGEIRHHLKQASFCRVRNCIICQWRRTKLWQHRFFKATPALCLRYPTARFILLTLTVPNCPVAELRAKLAEMNAAWKRLVLRKEFSSVIGWIRTTEVTRESNRVDHAHPHFHVLLMVPPSYFGNNYIKRDRWLTLWQESMRDPSITQVDVRAVKSNRPKAGSQEEAESPSLPGQAYEELWGAAAEVLKYAVKPSDLLGKGPEDPASVEWFKTFVEQVHKLRFMATGGVFKDLFSEDPSEEEMIHAGDEVGPEEESSSNVVFGWDRPVQHYKRSRPKTA